MTIVSMKDAAGERWFFEWSSIVDAPTSAAMTEAELLEYYPRRRAEQAADEARRWLERKLVRIKEHGSDRARLQHGQRLPVPAEAVIGACNSAGEGGTWLSPEQQLELCIRRREDPGATMLGTPQDWVCIDCRQPIEGKRLFLGEDPACRRCVEKELAEARTHGALDTEPTMQHVIRQLNGSDEPKPYR